MAKKYTDEEYAAMLPKKQVGTAVLLFNETGKLLLVKPNYKDGWLLPGGSTNDNESPLRSAIRETKEEIGLHIPHLQLAGVYYRHKKGFQSDSLKFIFWGGILTDNQIVDIKLQTEVLEEYMFASPEKAVSLFTPSLKKSIPACLEAIKNNAVAYID